MEKSHWLLLFAAIVFMVGCGGEPSQRVPAETEQDLPVSATGIPETASSPTEAPLPDVPIDTREQALEAIHHEDIRIRWQAVGFLRANSETPFEDLRRAMDSDYEDVVSAAVAAIRDTAPAKDVLPVLMEALDHPFATVRTEAVIQLGNMGSEASPAVAAIEAQLETADARFQEKAREALEKING